MFLVLLIWLGNGFYFVSFLADGKLYDFIIIPNIMCLRDGFGFDSRPVYNIRDNIKGFKYVLSKYTDNESIEGLYCK